MTEFKRLFNKKCNFIILICFFLNAGMFVYMQLEGDSLTKLLLKNDNYNTIIMQNNYSVEETKAYLKRTEKETLSEEERKLKRDIRHQINYLSGYNEYVHKVIDNAEQMKRKSLFSDVHSRAYKNLVKTQNDYTRVKNKNLSLQNYSSVNKFFEYNYYLYFTLGIMIFIVYRLFEERENKMWSIVRLSRHGRFALALKRVIILCIVSFLLLAVFAGLVFVMSTWIYGGIDYSAAIQSIESFKDFTQNYSVFSYLCVFFFSQWLAVVSIVMLFWLFMSVFRNRNIPVIIASIIVGAEYILYNTTTDITIIRLLRNYNLMQFFKINDIFSDYNNEYIFGKIYNNNSVILFLLFIIFIASVSVGLWVNASIYPEGKINILRKVIDRISELNQRLFQHTSIVIKEIYKLFFTAKGKVVVFFMIILTIYFVSYGNVTFTDDEIRRDEMYLVHGGKDYTYISQLVETAQKENEEALAFVQQVGEEYNNGNADIEQVLSASAMLDRCKAELLRLSEYINKIQYLSELKANKGIDGWLISDRGYDEIFGPKSILREIFLLIIMCGSVFLIVNKSIKLEYQSGMAFLNNTAQNGRGWLFLRKLAAAAFFSFMVWFIEYIIDFSVFIKRYGLPYLDAPAASLSFMGNFNSDMSIGTYLLIGLVVRLVLSELVGLMTVAVLKVQKKVNNHKI